MTSRSACHCSGPLSLRRLPWIDDVHPSSFKRAGVAGGDGEAVGERDGRNEGIGRFDRQAGSAGFGQQLGMGFRTSHIERQHPIGEHRQQALFQVLMQAVPALSCRNQSDTCTQLGYRDRGKVERFQRLRVDPVKDAGIGFLALRLRNHVRIEQDHLKLAARAGDLMPALSNKACSSSLRPPASRAMEARKEPSFTRPSGFAARSKMSRISASVLRPCWAAWIRMARCTSSGRFLTFTFAIWYLSCFRISMIPLYIVRTKTQVFFMLHGQFG
ncbi:hypothetical protein HDEF_2171 [Candidatus Hamiltonella defensa 5AT (Acyrthosiphon pisum)]|uniref:Uncharacterized protein n=1 Tax=Hamiltonella defensa subsp. Acyrthosiphon pisum (strain 5AT) TaxID=572265 RepID=C4K871_HAMD5|nr:hypothetical protein HDEF_2171 [Candidatus Hamiltonella defensa 5AT (Acyrthosiphon pisum)]